MADGEERRCQRETNMADMSKRKTCGLGDSIWQKSWRTEKKSERACNERNFGASGARKFCSLSQKQSPPKVDTNPSPSYHFPNISYESIFILFIKGFFLILIFHVSNTKHILITFHQDLLAWMQKKIRYFTSGISLSFHNENSFFLIKVQHM